MIRKAILAACMTVVATASSAQDGAALYTQRCASCHDNGAVSRAPARDVIAALSPDRIVESLDSGAMRVQGETLSPAERRAIAAYVSTASASSSGNKARNCASASTPMIW